MNDRHPYSKPSSHRYQRWLLRPLLACHRRLLPDDPDIGWTPYLWLIYLGFFFIEWYLRPLPAWEWGLSAATVGLFLLLYFRSYWVASRERFWLNLGIAGIGLVMVPINHGAIVFFIYAMASAGTLQPKRLAVGTILGILLVFTLQAWWLSLPLQYGLVGILIGGLIGLTNLYFTGRAGEYASLRLDQAEVRALASARERERIARDLHDLLGQSLSMVNLKAQLARRLVKADPARAEKELADIEAGARRALAQVREAVGGYRRAGLAAECADARVSLGSREIEFDYSLPAEGLPSDLDAELALVLREAVTNVIRHSRADRCHFRLRRENDCWLLDFSDNGRVSKLAKGNGLNGICDRIQALGGDVQFNTHEGFHIGAQLPIPNHKGREAAA